MTEVRDYHPVLDISVIQCDFCGNDNWKVKTFKSSNILEATCSNCAAVKKLSHRRGVEKIGLSTEQIEEALEEGRKEAEFFKNNQNCRGADSIRYR
jgi:transcription elongation factor Elf1